MASIQLGAVSKTGRLVPLVASMDVVDGKTFKIINGRNARGCCRRWASQQPAQLHDKRVAQTPVAQAPLRSGPFAKEFQPGEDGLRRHGHVPRKEAPRTAGGASDQCGRDGIVADPMTVNALLGGEVDLSRPCLSI